MEKDAEIMKKKYEKRKNYERPKYFHKSGFFNSKSESLHNTLMPRALLCNT